MFAVSQVGDIWFKPRWRADYIDYQDSVYFKLLV
jgi:hypothetical protein